MKYIFMFMMFALSLQIEAKPCKKITNALLDLYPEHTKSIMVTRLENARDKHKFLRSFIPYYYQQVYKHADELPAFQKAKATQGHIAGDAHVENFGFLVDNNGKGVLGLNDFDDVAQSSLVLDVMRLSQSASYMDKELDHAKLIQSYMKGLKDGPHEYSAFVQKLSSKSNSGGHLTKAEYATTANGKSFSVRQAPTFATSADQKKVLQDLLKTKFGPNAVLHDSYRTMKESGGSAWGKRYHLLAEYDGQVHFIELKEAAGSGVVPELVSKAQTNKDRILDARDVFLGKNFDQKLDVVTFENESFQLRFKSEGNKSIDFGKLKAKDYPRLIEDEFYILGQLHRKSLAADPAKIERYSNDLNTITAKEWEATIKVMKQRIKKAFDLANP